MIFFSGCQQHQPLAHSLLLLRSSPIKQGMALTAAGGEGWKNHPPPTPFYPIVEKPPLSFLSRKEGKHSFKHAISQLARGAKTQNTLNFTSFLDSRAPYMSCNEVRFRMEMASLFFLSLFWLFKAMREWVRAPHKH